MYLILPADLLHVQLDTFYSQHLNTQYLAPLVPFAVESPAW